MLEACPLAAANARRVEAVSENGRRLLQTLLQRIAIARGQAVADALGVDDSTISRIVSGESGIKLIALHGFLDVLDLKIVPKGHVCIDAAEWQAKELLLRRLMERETQVAGPQVDWNS